MELIRKIAELGRLTRAISKQERWKSLEKVLTTKTKEHYLLMCAPATAALAIAHSGLHTSRAVTQGSRPVSMLIINAQTIEWIDEGQWYRHVAPMLDWNGELTVTVQTEDRGKHRHSRVTPALGGEERIDVRVIESNLAEAWGHVSPDEFDLAIWFCPDFSAKGLAHGWAKGRPKELSAGGLGALLQRQVPVYFTSFSQTQEALNTAIAAAYGFGAENTLEQNPFSLVSKREGENWSRTISLFEPSFEEVDAIDEVDAALLTLISQMVLHSHVSGWADQPYEFGQACIVDGRNMIHSMDGICVDLASGSIWEPSESGPRPAGELPATELARIEEFNHDWSRSEKLIWAACVKNAAIGNDLVRAA